MYWKIKTRENKILKQARGIDPNKLEAEWISLYKDGIEVLKINIPEDSLPVYFKRVFKPISGDSSCLYFLGYKNEKFCNLKSYNPISGAIRDEKEY